jgi:hypothetical protein
VHPLLSLQTTGAPAWHEPPPQMSPVVQALPSSHEFVLFVWVQPDAPLHASSVHGLLSLQSIAGPPLQLPLLQTSPLVQAFPSSHEFVLLLC